MGEEVFQHYRSGVNIRVCKSCSVSLSEIQILQFPWEYSVQHPEGIGQLTAHNYAC